MTTPSNTSSTYTWQGKGLRLIDLMDNEERKAVLGAFPSERQFRSMHVTGDATEFVKYAGRNGLLETSAEELLTCQVYEKTLEGLGYQVDTAMDGRFEVVRLDDVSPVRGTIPPGSRSVSEIAYDYLKGLEVQGTRSAFPVTTRAQKPVFVSREFAEYLRAVSEPVEAVKKDADGDVAFIWPARNDQQLERVMRDFRLASVGANEPDSGQIAAVAASKTPKQFAIWKAGLGDQWRMMDSLRDVLISAAAEMTPGSFADQQAGGVLSDALRAFQKAFQYLAEDAMEGKPSLRTAAELKVVANQMVQTAAYLEKQAPVRQLPLNQVLVDGFDLAATIGNDLVNHHAAYERAQNRPQSKEVGASNGLG